MISTPEANPDAPHDSGCLSCNHRFTHLPAELLIHILLLVARSTSRASSIVQLSHVCRQWRLIMLDTPDFWTIRLPYRKDGLRTFLKRSQDIPLHLYFQRRESTYSSDYFGILLQNISRALTIDFVMIFEDEYIQALRAFESTTFHHLQKLDITADAWSESPFRIPDSICHHGVPSLRQLTLTNCELAWPASGLMRGLTTFYYEVSTGIHGRAKCPSVTQLLDALKSGSMLESLELVNALDGSNDVSLDAEPITLPRLRYLSLLKCHSNAVVTILAALMLPKDVSIDIRASGNVGLSSELMTAFDILGRIGRMSSPECAISNVMVDYKWGITIHGQSHTLTNQQQNRALRIGWGQVHVPLSIHQIGILRHMCSPSLLALTVTGLTDWTVPQWRTILSAAQNLECIALGGSIEGISNFLALVIRSHPDSPYHIPQLKQLTLKQVNFAAPALISNAPAESGLHQESVTFYSHLLCALNQRREHANPLPKLCLLGCYHTEEWDVVSLREAVGELDWVPPTGDYNFPFSGLTSANGN